MTGRTLIRCVLFFLLTFFFFVFSLVFLFFSFFILSVLFFDFSIFWIFHFLCDFFILFICFIFSFFSGGAAVFPSPFGGAACLLLLWVVLLFPDFCWAVLWCCCFTLFGCLPSPPLGGLRSTSLLLGGAAWSPPSLWTVLLFFLLLLRGAAFLSSFGWGCVPPLFCWMVRTSEPRPSFWDVADVVHGSARHLPARTSLPPRATIRAMRVNRESVKFDPALNGTVPGRIAILRGLHASAASYSSGWAAFADACGWPHFPTPHRVAAWAAIFRSVATFTQHISALRFGCRLSDGDTSWSDSFVAAEARGLRRASVVSAARSAFAPSDVEKLVRICDAESMAVMALGYLLAWTGLLRAGSEHLSRCFGEEAKWRSQRLQQTYDLCQDPSTCTMVQLCVVHRALKTRSSGVIRHGDEVCPETYSSFGTKLRRHCALAQILGPVGTHGFRRGMARLLACSSGGVSEILRAGGWLSASFASYLDRDDLHAKAIAELFTDASDGD